jgi:hypothetical protein
MVYKTTNSINLWMPIKMVIGLEDLDKRIDKIERHKEHKNLANVEFLSNATFFGKIKKANHEYAKNRIINKIADLLV